MNDSAFTDARPVFVLAATGHKDVIPAGPWMYRGDPAWATEVPGVDEVWKALDFALSRRWAAHRVFIHARDSGTGIDHAVRCYAGIRKLFFLPIHPQRDIWGEAALYRRDLQLVVEAHAVLWFGEEESDADPYAIAVRNAIPAKAVRQVG